MRHLGALGFFLFWVLAASGIYLYARLDTSAAGAYASIGGLEWWLGGVLRSAHRYAADLFVVVALAHLARELWLGRFRGWHAFAWLSGVPLVALLYASGLVGYWLVWDARSQFSYLATLEWLGLAAGAEHVPDRLFSLFVFLHIGLPLALLAGMWVHVQRLGRPQTAPPRRLAWSVLGMLATLAALRPALSEPQWDAALAPRELALDWFYQFVHPLMYAASPATAWALVATFFALLLGLPFAFRARRVAAARVDAANCNGCGRCVADCPYQAVTVSAAKRAVVLAERCAACGICAGACPSSTPFRSLGELVSGIELPALTMQQLKQMVREALASGSTELVFCCRDEYRTGAIALPCLAMLPPAFVSYALRNGAKTVRALACREQCAYRIGDALCEERFTRTREPRLRANVRIERKDNEYSFALP